MTRALGLTFVGLFWLAVWIVVVPLAYAMRADRRARIEADETRTLPRFENDGKGPCGDIDS